MCKNLSPTKTRRGNCLVLPHSGYDLVDGLCAVFLYNLLLTAKPKPGRALFLLKTGFWPSYCQISADLDKILHTSFVVRNILDRRVGGSRPNQNDYIFVILVTHPKSYNYRDDGSPRFRRQTVRVEVRTSAIVKNSGIL